jgi:hypothetical protein
MCRTKLKQTEMECEYLKRCFSSLTEENRWLQREVEELRTMRVACGGGGRRSGEATARSLEKGGGGVVEVGGNVEGGGGIVEGGGGTELGQPDGAK